MKTSLPYDLVIGLASWTGPALSEATAMILPPPPLSIPAQRELNRVPLDSRPRPSFDLASGPQRPEKHFAIRKKTQPGGPPRPIASVHQVEGTLKTSGQQKLSAKKLSLRHILQTFDAASFNPGRQITWSEAQRRCSTNRRLSPLDSRLSTFLFWLGVSVWIMRLEYDGGNHSSVCQ